MTTYDLVFTLVMGTLFVLVCLGLGVFVRAQIRYERERKNKQENRDK